MVLKIAINIILLLLLVTAAYPQEGPGSVQEKAATAKEDDRLPIQKQDEWQFFLSPYMWITGINVNITTLKQTTTTAVPWWDVAAALFSNAIGVMGRAEVWKGRWGVYLDGYYTYVGASGSQVGARKIRASVRLILPSTSRLTWAGLPLTFPSLAR